MKCDAIYVNWSSPDVWHDYFVSPAKACVREYSHKDNVHIDGSKFPVESWKEDGK